MVEARAWGDGGGKTRRHEIADMSYEMGVIACAVDGDVVHFGPGIPADVAWGVHRGVSPETATRAAVSRSLLADDDEVSTFLRRLSGESGLVSRSAQREPTTIGEQGDLTDAFLLLDRLAALEDTCTCGDGGSIFACPNYIEGDESLIGDE